MASSGFEQFTQQVAELSATLDSWALSFGTHRVSVLDIVSFLLVAIIIYIVAHQSHRFVLGLIRKSTRLDLSQKALLQKLIGIGFFAAAIFIGIDLLGIDLTALAVFSGALGLAVGFGLQRTLSNLIAGLILLMDKSVKPGDVIVVGDTFGAINKIGIRAVSVLTRDGKEHLIPNELLMTEPVENWSYSSRNIRIKIPVGIAYTSDLELAQRLMIEAATTPSRVLTNPAPVVWLKAFGDNSVDHEIRIWISDPEAGVGNIRSAILNRIWVLFKENNIEIPFPQRDVHIRSMPPREHEPSDHQS
jgi:small-conductance mechanosensitive channel